MKKDLSNPSGPVQLNFINNVATVTLNRPNDLNTLTGDVIDSLTEAFSVIATDANIKVAVLTGNGRAFSAGLDLKMLSNESDVFQKHNKGQQTEFIEKIAKCPKPVIGAINGVAVAGGLELALCCDFLYASDTAKFADTHAFVGVLPGWGLSQKLPRIVGINRAKELSFSGRFFDAFEAQKWGLVNEVFPKETLMSEVLNLAKNIATADMPALLNIKSLMDHGWNMSLEDGLNYETQIAVPYSKSIDLSQMTKRLEQLKNRKTN
ncbi:enoyl-CoA hydratase [Paraglaciecola sp. 2405UD69-4]|uniref:enoyl-CoA hydratase n=1 Tax=Paraglaciecola sp. 2405UD69-4 TaxID=3391836 RepID=UPI0039C98982